MVYILTQQSMVENENGTCKSGNLFFFFTALMQLMILLKCKVFRASCLHIIKDTDVGPCNSDILIKVETLSNIAFKME